MRHIVVFLVVMLVLPVFTLAADKKVNVYLSDQPPFTHTGAREGQGIIGRIVKKNALFTGFYVQTHDRHLTWKDAINAAQLDPYGVFLVAQCNSDRQKYFLCSDPISYVEHVLITRSDFELRYDGTAESLAGNRIGVINTWYYGNPDLDNNPAIDKARYSGNHNMLSSLWVGSEGAPKAVVTGKKIFQYFIDHSLPLHKNQFKIRETIAKQPLVVLINKAHPSADELLNQINSRLPTDAD